MKQKAVKLDPAKVRVAVDSTARAMGVKLRPFCACADAAEVDENLGPYEAFARITLLAGAFDYPRNENPTGRQLTEVVMDLLYAVGEANSSHVVRLRTAMIDPSSMPEDHRRWLEEPIRPWLSGVTITGADDGVDPVYLADLSLRYPFVEWAFLCSLTREGAPRYPKPETFRKFTTLLCHHRQAAHLCGDFSEKTLEGVPFWLDYAQSRGIKRVQMNGFGQKPASESFVANVERLALEVILQAGTPKRRRLAEELAKRCPKFSVLCDGSGGRGRRTRRWPTPKPHIRYGYAGGLSPDNVVDTVEKLIERERIFWIDVESGVRDEKDRFDLEKVERFLELCAPYATKPDDSGFTQELPSERAGFPFHDS